MLRKMLHMNKVRLAVNASQAYQEQSMNDRKGDASIRYRPMTAQDIAAVHKLSLSVLWPHRLEDWKFILELGMGIVAEDDTGVLGTVMCWVHGSDYASIGMLIVSPEQQSRGIGRELIFRILKEVGERTVVAHAAPSGKALFESAGFTHVGMVHQHQGSVFRAPIVPLGAGERIRPVSQRDETALADMASRAIGMPRATVIRHLLTVADGVAIDLYGELIGYSTRRKFGHGYVIGPVLAPDAQRAKALIAHWAGAYAGSFIRVDVPETCGLSPWLTDMGLVQVEQTALTMVRGNLPRPDPAITRFALLSQSLG